MAGTIDAKSALEVVAATVDLLEHESSFLSMSNKQRHFFTCCCVDDKEVCQGPFDSEWSENRVHGVVGVLVLGRVRQLLLVVVPPAVDVPVLCDGEVVTEPADDLGDLGLSFEVLIDRELDLDRLPLPSLIERCRHRSPFSSSSTLPKGIITHRKHLPIGCQKQDMIKPRPNLLQGWEPLYHNRLLVDHQLSHDLRY